MKITIMRHPISDVLAYSALFLFISISILDTSFYAVYIPSFIHHSIIIGALGLVAYREFLKNNFDFGSLSSMLLVFILIVLSLLSNDNLMRYIPTLLFIFFLRDFHFHKSISFVLVLTIFWFSFIIITSKLGIIIDYVEISATRIRHYLGFRYSLYPSTILLNIIAMFIYHKGRDINFKEWLVLLLVTFWTFNQTNSRLTFISSLLLLSVGLVNKLFPELLSKVRLILFFMIPSYLVASIGSYFIAIRYNLMESHILLLDSFLGRRIYLANKSLARYGFGILGKDVNWVGNGLDMTGRKSTFSYLYVDNMYVQILQRYGWLFLAIILVLLTSVLLYLYKKKQYLLMTIMILFAFHALIDDLIFKIQYNIFWLTMLAPFLSDEYYFKKDKLLPMSVKKIEGRP